MSKRKRISKTEKWIKEGRGTGVGSEYKPWLKIQDVSSNGRSTRLKGIKSKRQYEFLSDLERNFFYIVEFSGDVIDIREQFPLLPIEETIVIADELGIKHPMHPVSKEPVVMTTDFLITVNTQKGIVEEARTIKVKDELLKERVLEKFEIEREYWKRRNVDWGIVTESEISKIIALNISYFYNYYFLDEYYPFNQMNEIEIQMYKALLIDKLFKKPQTVLRQVLHSFDIETQLPVGSGITLFYNLLITKMIKINLSEKLDFDKIVSIDFNNPSTLSIGGE